MISKWFLNDSTLFDVYVKMVSVSTSCVSYLDSLTADGLHRRSRNCRVDLGMRSLAGLIFLVLGPR